MSYNNEKQALFDEMEERLIKAEKDLKEIKRFNKRLKEINKNLQKLSNYYHTDWLEDMEAYEKQENSGKSYKMMAQDPIWNVTQEHYEQKVRLIKILANAISKGI